MKSVAVIFPDSIKAEEITRKYNFIMEYFGQGGVITYYSPNDNTKKLLKEYLPQDTSVVDFKATALNSDILIFYKSEISQGYHHCYSELQSCQHTEKIYAMEIDGRIRCVAPELTTKDFPHMHTHAFNTLGPKSPDGELYFFPYGYLYKYTGLGPTNPFGFRIADNYQELAVRPKNHKLILFFGGSGTWSMCCAKNEVFTVLLEEMLNEYCKDKQIDLNFSVLNFGVIGNLLINQTINYILFAQKLNPDYIVSHDGWNDLQYGMMGDKFLLNEHQIAYLINFEKWSQMLHNTKNLKGTQPCKDMQIINLPDNIISSYIERKKQFCLLAEQNDTKFIWALQPCMYSKRELSAEEESSLKPSLDHTKDTFSETHKRMKYLYEVIAKHLSKVERPVLNLHEHFREFGKEETLFRDIVHTSPLGDSKIAQYYFEYFQKIIEQEQ